MATADLSRINTNIGALNSLNVLRDVQKNLALHQQRLSSGQRINSAADDPAGLTLATKLQVRSDSLQQASDNIGDAKNLLSVAEGGLSKINDILGQMRVKAEAAASDALGGDERSAISTQLTEFTSEIDNIVSQTKWNGSSLLNTTSARVFQTGADQNETTSFNFLTAFDSNTLNVSVGTTTAAVTIGSTAGGVSTLASSAVATGNAELASGDYTVRIRADGKFRVFDQYGNAMAIASTSAGGTTLTSDWQTAASSATWITGRGATITFAATIAAGDSTFSYTSGGNSVSSNSSANAYLANLDTAISSISTNLNKLGSMVARLTYKEENLSTAKVNTDAAHSRIMDADLAEEQLQTTKYSILQQTATSMLTQANAAPQSLLSLFR